ncbi:MAG: D-alanyl-D-alanine carboxypeptidase, partial [Lachnospiraceae bacterium]|nr:D-alanyl-D-alanine carboxypeptidase [Lachnospiraceae bacterium]
MTLPERKRKVRQTIALMAVFVAACIAMLLVIVISRQMKTVDLPLAWTNERMAYTSAEQSAMQSGYAFSEDLCIGPSNVSMGDMTLMGNEKGALFSLDDRAVVYAREMHEKVYPASITKLMTAILAFKSDKLDEMVTITWKDLELESGSQVVGLRIGDQVSMHSLMRGLLIHSGNDAAQAVARV